MAAVPVPGQRVLCAAGRQSVGAAESPARGADMPRVTDGSISARHPSRLPQPSAVTAVTPGARRAVTAAVLSRRRYRTGFHGARRPVRADAGRNPPHPHSRRPSGGALYLCPSLSVHSAALFLCPPFSVHLALSTFLRPQRCLCPPFSVRVLVTDVGRRPQGPVSLFGGGVHWQAGAETRLTEFANRSRCAGQPQLRSGARPWPASSAD